MIDEKSVFPKVSILIPVFNRKEYITECIQSALDQNFTDFEVVVVDNASNDGTWEICQRFAADDQRIRVFRNDSNIGPVRNWMRCAQKAKGEYSKILFSDDSLEPNCLSEMVPKLVDPKVALVYCAARIGKSRDESIVAYSQADSSRLSSTQLLNLILCGKAPVSPGAILIRTFDLIKNLHAEFQTSTPRSFEENGAGSDVMILLLTAHNYSYVANISTPLVYFRAHAGSFTIENSNNDVAQGYRSAIALFLIKNYSRQTWLKYLVNGWIQQMRFDQRWRNPRSHLIEYEGSGSIVEIFIFLFFIFKYIKNKVL